MSDESGQMAKLNSYHCDIDPRFGAGRSGFVITDQSALTHQPAKGALHDPAARQHFETNGSIRTFDDLDRQLGAKLLDPLSEGFTGIAESHTEDNDYKCGRADDSQSRDQRPAWAERIRTDR